MLDINNISIDSLLIYLIMWLFVSFLVAKFSLRYVSKISYFIVQYFKAFILLLIILLVFMNELLLFHALVFCIEALIATLLYFLLKDKESSLTRLKVIEQDIDKRKSIVLTGQENKTLNCLFNEVVKYLQKGEISNQVKIIKASKKNSVCGCNELNTSITVLYEASRFELEKCIRKNADRSI